MTRHDESTRPPCQEQITLRSPAELADALPYLLGFHPTDSVIMVALHGPRGRFGGRLRLGIPGNSEEWPEVSDQLAECLVSGSRRRGARPDGIVLFVCQDPAGEESGQDVMERLRPFAQRLRTACGALDVPVYEALCISDGRFWSYCCPDSRCCPPEGTPLVMPGTSAMAAAATFAGVQVRGTLREMEARLTPLATSRNVDQERALDTAGAALVPRILDGTGAAAVREETLDLAARLMDRLRSAPPLPDPCASDLRDDGLIGDDEAAGVIVGLQDRVTRDRAAEWMEGAVGESALRLWRALARRCVGPYGEHAAAPLTLAGWVAWSIGDEPSARVALGRALRADPDYHFARLLHQACNDGIDPEPLRRCLRQERVDHALHAAIHAETERATAMDTARRAAADRAVPGGGSEGTAKAGRRKATAVPQLRPGGTSGPKGRDSRSRPRRRSGQRGTRSRR